MVHTRGSSDQHGRGSGPQLIGDWWELAAWTGRFPNQPKLAKSTMAFKQDLEPHNTLFQMSKIQMIVTYLGHVRMRTHTHTQKDNLNFYHQRQGPDPYTYMT